MSPHALISGAGVAGPVVAHQLAARGWRTTVLERAPRLRDEGQNVELRGSAREVARRIGIEDAVLAAGTHEAGVRFVDETGREIAAIAAGDNDTDGLTAEAEILRGELGRLLYERTHDEVDYRFDTRVREIDEHADGVRATLSTGETVEADVLVVADGTRSRTRAMLFDDVRVRELGLYVAYLPVPRVEDDDDWWSVHNTTGTRGVQLRPGGRGDTRAALGFLSTVRGLADLDRDAQVEVLRRTFADVGWQTSRVLDALPDAPFYFDAVAQVHAPTWSTRRTVLVGDAAWSTGPFGTGTTLAMTGGYVLAGELATRALPEALAAYERTMRPFAQRAQAVSPALIRALNPDTRAGLVLQRALVRAAGAVAGGPLGRLTAPLTRPPSDAVDLPEYDDAPPVAPEGVTPALTVRRARAGSAS